MSTCMSNMFNNESTNLCSPLQRLKKEHIGLNRMKQELVELSTAIETTNEDINWKSQMEVLREKVIAFMNELGPHSEREEGVLFEMMAKYIGRDHGPIAVMEYEHDEAKRNIAIFLENTEQLTEALAAEESKQLASHITTAYTILTEHFTKEENVLFPMAENMLTDEEKVELEQRISEI